MALWQYSFWLVPRQQLAAIFGAIPSSLAQDEFESLAGWAERDRHAIERQADGLLPRRASQSTKARLWGTADGDCLELSGEEPGRHTELYGRLDLRDADVQRLGQVVHMAEAIDAVFVTSDYDVFEPGLGALSESIMESAAFRFVTNPRGFFERLAREQGKWGGPDGAP